MRPSEVTRSDVESLLELLHSRGRVWTAASLISRRTQDATRHGKGWDRRYIAALAEQAGGRIISTTRGYKLQDHATDKEIMDAYHELTRKAESTGKRATTIMKYYHQHRLRRQAGTTPSAAETQASLL